MYRWILGINRIDDKKFDVRHGKQYFQGTLPNRIGRACFLLSLRQINATKSRARGIGEGRGRRSSHDLREKLLAKDSR